MRYCSKCGSEVTEGVKFCKNCGAPVKSAAAECHKNQAVVAKKGSTNKSPVKKIAAMLVVVIVGIGLLSKVFGAVSVPDYEKPLKTQIDAINKNDVDKYLESFSAAGKEIYRNSFSKEDLEEIKKVSYEVVAVEEYSLEWAIDFLNSYGGSIGNIEDAKILSVKFEYESVDGETGSSEMAFKEVKINGKWYAIDSIAG